MPVFLRNLELPDRVLNEGFFLTDDIIISGADLLKYQNALMRFNKKK